MSAALLVLLAAVALILTVFMLRKGVNIGYVMLIDSAFLVFLSGMAVDQAVVSAFHALVSWNTIKLILLLFLIMMLENIMRNTGMIKEMVDSLKELLGNNRLAAAFLPTVMGLLPSPGGARFSCPMVEEMTGKNTGNSNKAFINYWFRHTWLDGFILYPGAIVAAELVGMSVLRLFLYLTPFIFLNMLVGSVFGLRGIKKEAVIKTRAWNENLKMFILSMLPVIVLMTIYILLLNHTHYSLEIACIVVVVSMLLIKRYSMEKIADTVKEAFPIKLVLIIIGVMVFKEILFDSKVLEGLPQLMKSRGIPVQVLFLLLPLAGGFASGITVSYVSMTFPILISLGLTNSPWQVAAAFCAGAIGTMITPLHLCAGMSADYFKTSLDKLLIKVAAAETVLLAVCIIQNWNYR